MATATRTTQPPWTAPPQPAGSIKLPPLKIYNSLTRSKNQFIPLDPAGKKVTWYSCGPTVYDVSHLGHARNYVSTDIIRRILKDYFEFDVRFVMNITDVDDKIILRARQQHFWADFRKSHATVDAEVVDLGVTAFWAYVRKNLPLVEEGTTLEKFIEESERVYKVVRDGGSLAGDGTPPGDKEAKLKMHLRTTQGATKAILEAQTGTQADASSFWSSTEDIFLPYLDSLHGSSIDPYDRTIFTNLTKHYENLFFEDMRNLNVLDPDDLTRVTEFGPQIVQFVDKIIQKGFAYSTSDGSVYFDISNFEKAGNSYARLEPWNRNDKDLQADGEGAIFAKQKASEKKGDSDFALWKGSKAGEPAWKSPWGDGRPGWHIECSVMASETLGKQMDIHSGGIDLAFPHHDNELAQSEAYWTGNGCADHNHEWVKYFLHMGHLSIQGHKMSKSLKNFTSIREALAPAEDGFVAWTPRGLRTVFLLGGWKDGVEITEDLVKQGKSWEEKVTNFFLKALDIQRNNGTSKTITELNSSSKENLTSIFEKAKTDLNDALCDSFNTPTGMDVISSLITQVNSIKYLDLDAEITIQIAKWITKIVTILGLNGSVPAKNLELIGWDGVTIPQDAQSYIYPLAQLRDQVRSIARSKEYSASSLQQIKTLVSEDQNSTAAFASSNDYATTASQFRTSVLEAIKTGNAQAKDLLVLCDTLRDTHLWNLDIYLEDRDAPLGALVRPLDSSLKQARADKERIVRDKAEAKAKREIEDAEKQKERDEKAKISPKGLFRTKEYSEWDEEGVPTKDAKGEEITKSKRKGLVKEWTRQKKVHEEWLKRVAK